MKRFLVVLLVLIFCLPAAATAQAQNGSMVYKGFGFGYSIENAEATITWARGNGKAYFPKTVEGVPVRAIGPECVDRTSKLTALVIPEGVVRIEERAFMDNKALKSIRLPKSLKIIGEYAFFNNTKLTSVTIPDGVEVIQGGAFAGCSRLKSVKLGKNVRELGDSARCLHPGHDRRDDYGVFIDCVQLSRVVFNKKLEKIGDHAFCCCERLKTVTIPDTVKEIGECAFLWAGLKRVDLPNNLKSISERAFSYTPVEKISLPRSVSIIDREAFSHCTKLKSAKIPGVTSIEGQAFAYCAKLKSIEFPEGLRNIGTKAFYECRALSSAELPSTLKSIGGEVFYNCRNLGEVFIPAGLEQVEGYSFGGCLKIKRVTVAHGAKRFEGCRFEAPVQSVLVPETVTYLAPNMFEDMSRLVFTCSPGSAAEQYAKERGIACRPLQKVEKIKLNKASMKLSKGSSASLKATLTPAKASYQSLSWQSSDPAIATVSASGKVKGVGRGTAVIAVSATDGGNASAACKVTVK